MSHQTFNYVVDSVSEQKKFGSENDLFKITHDIFSA